MYKLVLFVFISAIKEYGKLIVILKASCQDPVK